MPKIIDHNQRRREIAEAAIKLFAEKGYAGLGMRDIARSLGVSKTHIYHYFPTKEQLFEACLGILLEAAMGFTIEANHTKPIDKRVRTVVEYYSRVIEEFGKEILIFTDLMRQPDGHMRYRQVVDRHQAVIRKQITNYLGATMEDGKSIHELLLGALIRSFLTGKRLDRGRLTQSIIKILM